MCKIIVCSSRSLILGGKNVHPSFAYSSCSTHIVLYHIYDIDYVYRIYYMMHAAVYLVVERSHPPMPPCPLSLGRLHSTHPVPVWAKRAVCHKVSSAQPAERHKWPKSRLSHIPHPCYLSNPWILNMFLLSGKPFTPKIDINYEVTRFYSMILWCVVSIVV